MFIKQTQIWVRKRGCQTQQVKNTGRTDEGDQSLQFETDKMRITIQKIAGYTSNTMHWNRTNCWNCGGKLIATTRSSYNLARVLTSCGIVGKKWGTNGETKLKFVSVLLPHSQHWFVLDKNVDNINFAYVDWHHRKGKKNLLHLIKRQPSNICLINDKSCGVLVFDACVCIYSNFTG